ncbi:hippurate hydrolase [Luteimicrobium album]|uniref:Hippurate hydrolase n=1 Tax=Luteimicrobium album TaxID=1054550 RepID=A0ABQ6HY05_9MICO|nr:amidohydrolase [Luteimicrobium album]GMA23017.1 hippurate hydrolase [Luteimicrobium album]
MTLDLESIYTDLHRNPELSYAEHRTAGVVADHLTALGLDVRTGVGGTGVVGVLANGDGPTVLLRADMDALPVQEETGLPYASTARGTDPDGNDVPVMHACGHDVHVTCLLGAVDALVADRASWAGTVVAVFQPAEELGTGAQAMVDDGLYEHAPRPDVVLGQHVSPLPAGVIGLRPGPSFAGADAVRVRIFGRGGHGSRPETTVDPVVLAASIIMRLQTVVAREIAATDTAVLTVGTVHAGTKENIIPDEATLGLSLRSYTPEVRERLLGAIRRITAGEAAAAGAPTAPEVTVRYSLAALVSDPAATDRTGAAFRAAFGDQGVTDPGLVTGSEDVPALATAAGVPLVFWLLGSEDPQKFAAAFAAGTLDRDIPSNHSPHFAPQLHPTLEHGVEALVVAAKEWLG